MSGNSCSTAAASLHCHFGGCHGVKAVKEVLRLRIRARQPGPLHPAGDQDLVCAAYRRVETCGRRLRH